MMGSFVSGMPVTGSFTRTALNDASGVRTPFGGIYTSVLVIAALGLLTGTFHFIPKPVLAAVILVAVVSMIEFHMVPHLWRTRSGFFRTISRFEFNLIFISNVPELDLVPLFVTLIACLFLGLDYGIIVGVGLNVLFILQKTARPNITHEVRHFGAAELVFVTPDQSLFYSSSEHFRSFLTKIANKYGTAEWIVIDGRHINHLDATVAAGLNILNKDFGYLKKTLILWKWKQQPLGVLYRNNPNFLNNFKHSETIEELYQELDLTRATSAMITIAHRGGGEGEQ